jgi:hypothetical protein
VTQGIGELLLRDPSVAVHIHLIEGGGRLGGQPPTLLMPRSAQLEQHPILLTTQEAVCIGVVDGVRA